MVYKKVISILLLIFFFSCEKKKLSNYPFIVTKNVTCNDLYENGYKWSPGVDVILLGKKIQDTIIYYQIHQEYVYNNIDFDESDEETLIDTIVKVNKYQKYLNQDPLILSDSIYSLVWGDIEEQQKNICKNSSVFWRNFELKIKESEVIDFMKSLDTINYKIIKEKKNKSIYHIRDFKVVNLIQKDTFNCYIDDYEGIYTFSSSIRLKNK